MYQTIKSIFKMPRAITLDDFKTDIEAITVQVHNIELETHQIVPSKDILIAFMCFGKFFYANKQDWPDIIKFLEKIIEQPANQTTIYWLCRYQLSRILADYYKNMGLDNKEIKEKYDALIKKIAADRPQFEQMKSIYGIREK